MPTPDVLEELRKLKVLSYTVEDIRSQDKRAKCGCPMPFVRRKWHRALGRLVELRLCCLAKVVEQGFGLPSGTLYETFEFEPTREWDCNETVKDRHGQNVRKGPPPKWLKDRMDKKGIAIKNLE